jgi:heterogeneous nuclear ribonucleoprotein A1/A3
MLSRTLLRFARLRAAAAPVARLSSARAFAPAPLTLRSPLVASRGEAVATFRTCAVFASEEAEAPAGGFRGADADRSNQLFVGNLPFTVDAQQLGALFEAYPVTDTKVVYDQETGRSKGIAFVTFASSEDATKAQTELNGSASGTRAAAC